MPGNQIIDDLLFLFRIDGCSVALDHLVDLSRPDLARKGGLIEHISRRMADDTLRRKAILSRPWWQIGWMIVQFNLLDGLRFRQARERNRGGCCRQCCSAFPARPSPQ